MSHIVAIKSQFVDQSCLVEALKQLGWQVREKCALTRTYPSDPKKGEVYDFIAINPSNESNAYDIGFKIEGNNVVPYCDPYGGSIYGQLGHELSKLKTEYAVKVAEDEFSGLGFMIDRSLDAQGNTILDISKPDAA